MIDRWWHVEHNASENTYEIRIYSRVKWADQVIAGTKIHTDIEIPTNRADILQEWFLDLPVINAIEHSRCTPIWNSQNRQAVIQLVDMFKSINDIERELLHEILMMHEFSKDIAQEIDE